VAASTASRNGRPFRRKGVIIKAAAVVGVGRALVLWNAPGGLFEQLGLSVVRDEAFRALVLGRIIEPTSKLDTILVLGELGVAPPSRVTFMRCLKRAVERDYRATVSDACFRHATRKRSPSNRRRIAAHHDRVRGR
jgi:hypothetical protein